MSAVLKFEVNGVKAGNFRTPSSLVLELECDSLQAIMTTVSETTENLFKLGYQLGISPVDVASRLNKNMGFTNVTSRYKKIGDFCGNDPQFPVSMQIYIRSGVIK